MTTADLLLIVGLVAFLFDWWIRRIPARRKVLWLFAAEPLACSAVVLRHPKFWV